MSLPMQGLLFCIGLLAMLAVFYHDKMKFERPVGRACLTAFRMVVVGAGITFASAGLLTVVDQHNLQLLVLGALGTGIILVFVGMAISMVSPCGKK